MPKTPEELESELARIIEQLKASDNERAALKTKIGEIEGKAKTLEEGKVSLEDRLKEALKIKEDVEALKSARSTPAPSPTPSPKPGEDDSDIESLLNEDDKKKAQEAFEKLSEDHQTWVLADKKNKTQFLSDVVGKRSAKKSLFNETKPAESIRDQIRAALNIETREEIPFSPGNKTPIRKGGKNEPEQEIVTSLPNGDVLGALKQSKEKK